MTVGLGHVAARKSSTDWAKRRPSLKSGATASRRSGISSRSESLDRSGRTTRTTTARHRPTRRSGAGSGARIERLGVHRRNCAAAGQRLPRLHSRSAGLDPDDRRIADGGNGAHVATDPRSTGGRPASGGRRGSRGRARRPRTRARARSRPDTARSSFARSPSPGAEVARRCTSRHALPASEPTCPGLRFGVCEFFSVGDHGRYQS